MRKEIALATVLTLGGGGVVEAQFPTPEMERLDLSPFLREVHAGVNEAAEPQFFREMDQRALESPNQYFRIQDIPEGKITLYYPDGLTKPAKVGYRETISNIMVDDLGGPLNAFATDKAVLIDLGKDGTLDGDNGVDLFNFVEIKEGVGEYLVEPAILANEQWQESPQLPITTYKLIQDESGATYIGGDQNGLLVVETLVIEIPKVGTDIPAS